MDLLVSVRRISSTGGGVCTPNWNWSGKGRPATALSEKCAAPNWRRHSAAGRAAGTVAVTTDPIRATTRRRGRVGYPTVTKVPT
ncbi:hypothetical protein Adu01nite_46820 [Paractinoplanes durhamensis]|uniref:Uncharacterized protein n=1 Tax=Paractinoplanes durhamensis TaxID=113563 RepID=A0ABQ3Z0I2_9ACTN|nr:hypothetical protein Adu01nite_46820 [Actinoplanes durhamensis]